MQPQNIREQFPALDQTVYGKPLVYLDNAATAQRPISVIKCQEALQSGANANIHRAVHRLAGDATEAYENTRAFVAKYLNAASAQEIVFTSGATAAINLVAFSFGEAFIHEGDEIIVSVAEHHSNIVPWQMLCRRKNAVLKVLDIEKNGVLAADSLQKLISQRTKIVAISHISNVLGLVNPVQDLVAVSHKFGVPVLVDGSQGVVHCKVDVQQLDCDFYVFSGHKIYAATGTGVLFGKMEWLEKMPPYMGGGEMIKSVSFKETIYAPVPTKFEAGTQSFNAVPTLKPALEFASTYETDPSILEYIYGKLIEDERVTLYGAEKSLKIPLFSFAVKGAHHEDLALIMDKMGIALRSGQMCAEPLMDRLGVTGLLRASFAPYNTIQEAEYFIKSLDKAIKMLI